jgi:hypothetical protein
VIYVWATLIGFALGLPLAWRVRRVYSGPGGRHHIRRGCLRYGTAREIRRHIRGGRVLTHARTFRSRVIAVASHELTARTARYWVVNLLAERTLEIRRSLLAAPAAPTR